MTVVAPPSVLATRLTVGGPVTPRDLLALLAVESRKLQRRAALQGRTQGEVEIDRQDDAYYLTWKDEHPVPNNVKRGFPINHPDKLNEGSGHYLSTESINGVTVRLLRHCEGHALVAQEVREVMEYRLRCVTEEWEALMQAPESDDPLVPLRLEHFATLKAEYEWFLKLLEAPQRT